MIMAQFSVVKVRSSLTFYLLKRCFCWNSFA